MDISGGVITAVAVVVAIIAVVVVVLAAITVSKVYSYLDTPNSASLVTLDEWNAVDGWGAKRDEISKYMFWAITLLLIGVLLSHVVIYAFFGSAATATCAILTLLVFGAFYYFYSLVANVGKEAVEAADAEIDINRAIFSLANVYLVYSILTAIGLAAFNVWKAYASRSYKSVGGQGVTGKAIPAPSTIARSVWA